MRIEKSFVNIHCDAQSNLAEILSFENNFGLVYNQRSARESLSVTHYVAKATEKERAFGRFLNIEI